MSEIKTCEQYVLARLQELENENSQLKYEMDEQANTLTSALLDTKAMIDVLNKHAVIHTFGDDNKKYLSIEIDGYGKHQDDFKAVCKLLSIDCEEEGDS